MDSTIKAGVAGGIGALVIFAVFTGLRAPAPAGAPSNSLAASPEVAALRLDFGRQLAASQCNGVGSPIVSITQKITNDADSGEAGNYWGLDSFNRLIQVWKTSTNGTYCAVVKYMGSFAGIEGQTSPGQTGTLSGKERGTIQGGYAATITGTLLSSPLWNTNGSVGSTDYKCDSSGNCPGAINWVTQYFDSNYNFSYDWWGWIYRAGANKTWVNSSQGNNGDII